METFTGPYQSIENGEPFSPDLLRSCLSRAGVKDHTPALSPENGSLSLQFLSCGIIDVAKTPDTPQTIAFYFYFIILKVQGFFGEWFFLFFCSCVSSYTT